MARLSALFLAFLLGAASAVALVSCGGGDEADLLPGTTADQIESNLDEVERLADEGNCVGAEDAVAEVAAEVEELQVDRRLKAALEEGTAKLSEAVGRCEEDEASEETEPTLETDVEAEEVEDDEKPKKEKPDEEAEEPAEPEAEPEAEEKPELPPQSNGKGEEKSSEVAPEAEEAPAPSGGVGPNVGVE
jgi:outer membrane biosynthesis protein TonB